MKKQKTDNTARERQARRRAELDRIARGLGLKSWTHLETEVINKRAKVSKA